MEPVPSSPPLDLRQSLRALRTPMLLALGAFVVLALFSGGRFWHQSKAPHFVYQAMAFLDGKLELTVPPPNHEDWAYLNGKWYSSFPAFPALLMVPLVAINGYQLNDTSFTVIVAALNLLAFYLVLRQLSRTGDATRTERENLLLTGLLCFGTLYFYCSIRGEVWFTAEVMGVGLSALYVLFAHRQRSPALAGLFFSAATLTRTPLLFSGVFFLCEVLAPEGSLAIAWGKRTPLQRRQQLMALGQFAVGALPLALWHAWMNWARFGSVGDFGHTHFFQNRVNQDIATWGLFHPHYLERNLRAAFLLLPKIQTAPSFALGYDPHGLSLLLTTPLFLLAFIPRRAKGAEAVTASGRPRLFLALCLTVLAMVLPGLFYQNDGYIQFGFRFSLDWTPYMFLLLATGRRKMDALWWSLAGVGLLVNLWGAVAFRGYSDMFG
jgi:hypothetical protein